MDDETYTYMKPLHLQQILLFLFVPDPTSPLSHTMKNENEARPFLEYSDDPAGSRDTDAISRPSENARPAIRNSRAARDLLVFLGASLLWLAAIFVVVLLLPQPWPGTAPKHGGHDRLPAQSSNGDYRLHNITSDARFVTCGTSTAEAQRNGCRYDTLLNHWVPAVCRDQEWIDEYQDDGSWTAFAEYVVCGFAGERWRTVVYTAYLPHLLTLLCPSVNLTRPLSAEDMGERDHYYTSIRDHVNHCAMLWRKQFWTLFEGRKVFDGVIVNTYHTEHCAEFLSDLMTMNRTEPTLVRVGFSGCWISDEDKEL